MRQAAIADRAGVPRDGVARLRAARAAHPEDRVPTGPIAEFTAQDEDFARLRAEREVRADGRGREPSRHPAVGTIAVDFEVLLPPEDPEPRLAVHRAADDGSRAAPHRLCGGDGYRAGRQLTVGCEKHDPTRRRRACATDREPQLTEPSPVPADGSGPGGRALTHDRPPRTGPGPDRRPRLPVTAAVRLTSDHLPPGSVTDHGPARHRQRRADSRPGHACTTYWIGVDGCRW
ncbi:hypothetical protein WN990_36935 [Kitasatospora purpeofusca]|uniref:MmyB family transcriptional regulator n=1 Tax=Kitasatospora purpeofusca TaxID=67352 RepID=UPI0030EFC79D